MSRSYPPGILSAHVHPRDTAPLTRRGFLMAGAAAAAGVALSARRAGASPVVIPLNARTRRTSPNAWIPDAVPAEELRALASVAMEAARGAGADFADIRIGVQRGVDVIHVPNGSASIALSVGYGVRAWINGTWSFQHGNVFTRDAVAEAARSAVVGARTYAAVNARLPRGPRYIPATDWVPAPVVTGTWEVPVEIDPFGVSLDDYHRVLETLSATPVERDLFHHVSIEAFSLGWNDDTRVFASTAGTLVTQYRIDGGPQYFGAGVGAVQGPGVSVDLPELPQRPGGFELAFVAARVDRSMTGVDDALFLTELPPRAFTDIGRFPIVFEGSAMAELVGRTVDAALDGDRVAGIEADASGLSFLAPADEILNADQPQFSPLLSMTADRAMPSSVAVQWDDDGVVSERYSLVEHGRVVGYHTTRETAPILAAWNQRHGIPPRSHGCSVAPTPASVPMGGGAHVHVASAAASASVRDLIRDMKHGFVIRGGRWRVDQGLTAGTFDRPWLCLEVKNGVPVARTSVSLQFATKTLFQKNFVAIGDATTVRTATVLAMKGIPWEGVAQQISAPAALCKEVDVIL